MGYAAMVDDNFHFTDKGSRYRLVDFAATGTAIDHCRRSVDETLRLRSSQAWPPARCTKAM